MAKMQKKKSGFFFHLMKHELFEKGRVDLVNLGDVTIGRAVLKPAGAGKNV